MEQNKKLEPAEFDNWKKGCEDLITIPEERVTKIFHMLQKNGLIPPSETLVLSKEMTNLAKKDSSSSKDK